MAKRAPARRRPRKAKPGTRGLTPAECRLEQPEGSAAEAAEAVEKAGGCVVGLYKEPLGGHPTLLSILPIDKIEPTPFQRDLSDAHTAVDRLGFHVRLKTPEGMRGARIAGGEELGRDSEGLGRDGATGASTLSERAIGLSRSNDQTAPKFEPIVPYFLPKDQKTGNC